MNSIVTISSSAHERELFSYPIPLEYFDLYELCAQALLGS